MKYTVYTLLITLILNGCGKMMTVMQVAQGMMFIKI